MLLESRTRSIAKKFGINNSSLSIVINTGGYRDTDNSMVLLNSAVVDIRCFVNNYTDAILFTKDIMNIMPQYSSIYSLEIINQVYLTPETVNRILDANSQNSVFMILKLSLKDIQIK
jgi:hypothetical protein